MNILPSPSCQPFFCDRVERSNKSAYSSLAVCEISIFSRETGVWKIGGQRGVCPDIISDSITSLCVVSFLGFVTH